MTSSAGRCGTCGCRSPTAATCAANTACRRRTTSGCRARTCCNSRRSSALVDVFLSLGVDKVRLTGGEPLLRRDLPGAGADDRGKAGAERSRADHQRRAARRQVEALKAAGLGRITVSLDTLQRDRFVQADALRRAAARARRHRVGAPCLRPSQDGHSRDSRRQRRRARADLIEYGEVGERRDALHRVHGRRRGEPLVADRVVSRAEMLETLARHYGADRAGRRTGSSAPAERFALRRRHDVRHHRLDDRAVLPHLRPQPPDRRWHVVPVPVRHARPRSARRRCARGATVDEIAALVAGGWRARDDRGAEERLALGDRRAFVPVQDLLKRDPHIEMHTRGG